MTTSTCTAAAPRDHLVSALFGASSFQFLRAGVELNLFRFLHVNPGSTSREIGEQLGLSERSTQILLRGVTALGLLEVTDDGHYDNGADTRAMFADGHWEIVESLVEFEAELVYEPIMALTESLRTDQNLGILRLSGGDAESDLYQLIAGVPRLEQLFFRCMRAWSQLSNPVLLDRAQLRGDAKVLDLGGGDGVNSIALARSYPHARFTVTDLPGAVNIARERIAEAGLGHRIETLAVDLFTEEVPTGYDTILLANQLVIWTPEENLLLLARVYEALPAGGEVLIFNVMSDDAGRGPLYSALDNAYFASLTAVGSQIYPWRAYEEWLTKAGFVEIERRPGRTWSPHGVVAARKP